MRRTVPVAACAAALIAAVAPAAARADKVIEADVVWRFDSMDYTIDQGEKLTFKNADTVSPGPHDVTANSAGPDGKSPVFRSKTIPAGQESVVEGAQQLKTGSYSFYCSVHRFMMATLNVTDKGTPLPAPGSESPPASAQPAAADTTKPSVHATLKATTLRRALRAGKLLATVTASELVDMHLSLSARLRGRTVTLGQATATDGAPRRKAEFAVKLSAAGRRALRTSRRLAVTLVVHATDQAGNPTTTRTRKTLRR